MIDTPDEDEIGGGGSGGNKTNLSNLSTSKKSTAAVYLISESVKRGGSNIKKDVKAAKDSDYLTPATKKAFNHLQYTFI